MDDRDRLAKRLRGAGCSRADLDRASAEGTLPTLALDHALGGKQAHTLTQVANASGLDTGFLREVMQAMGRPNPAQGDPVFTEDDIEIARVVRGFRDAGLSKSEVLEIGRVLGLSMFHTAEAIRRIVGNALLRPGDSEFTVALRYAEAVDHLAPLAPTLLGAELRAHLREGIRSHLVTEAEREAGRLDGTRDIAIAFADLVDYTRMGESLDPEDVGRIAGRLAEIAAAAAQQPVKLVKTIGDAAMFASPDVGALVESLLVVVSEVAKEKGDFPEVRVGIALGPATTRGGDWFGATVNLAARLAGTSKPGRISATEEVRAGSPRKNWKRIRRLRSLKGVSDRQRLYSLAGD